MITAIAIDTINTAHNGKTAIMNLTLSVPAGQSLGFLGPKGSGKTELLKVIAGLQTPDTGSVHINGHNLSRQRDQALQHVSSLVQDVSPLNVDCSLWNNISPASREKAASLLHEIGLWEHHNTPVHTLSHDLQRLAALVCVLCTTRSVLLLDEPTLGLDRRAQSVIKHQIRSLTWDQDKTIIIATRQPSLVQELCHRVVFLKNGQLVADLPVTHSLSLSEPATYQIRVKGILDDRWGTWFDSLSMETTQDETVLTGTVADQPALHGILNRIRNLGLPLISVQHIAPELEALFKDTLID